MLRLGIISIYIYTLAIYWFAQSACGYILGKTEYFEGNILINYHVHHKDSTPQVAYYI